jgi:glycosyl transferase family 25
VEWPVFDAIYLINLPEREDRKLDLERELRGVGLQADDPRLVWVRAVRPMEAGDFQSIGARGCFLSHLSCLQAAFESGHARVLILEDDACFPRSRLNGLKSAVGKLESLNWAIWYGGGHISHDSNVGIDDVEIIPIDHRIGVQTAHCVAFRGDAIRSVRTFLELILTRPGGHPEAGPMHVDGAYSTWRALNPTAVTFITVPPVCVQRSSRSDIAITRWFDKTPIVRRGIAALRRLRNQFRHRK